MTTVRELAEDIRVLAETQSDRVGKILGADSCYYVKGGRPSCIVGQALWDRGLIDASLEEDLLANELPFTEVAGTVVDFEDLPEDADVDHGDLDSDHYDAEPWWDDFKFIQVMQDEQDSGYSWGVALSFAEKRLGR